MCIYNIYTIIIAVVFIDNFCKLNYITILFSEKTVLPKHTETPPDFFLLMFYLQLYVFLFLQC